MLFRSSLGRDAGGNPHPQVIARGTHSSLTDHYKRLLASRQSTVWMCVLALLLLAVALPIQAQEDAAPITVTDAYGEEVTITDPSRIITIGGSVTEVVLQLGLGDQVVARDDSSLYPLSVNALPSVGYVRALSAEPVLAFDPTLIITTEDAGPPEAVEQLRAAGVTFLVVPHDDSIEGVLETITVIAAALDREAEGAALIEKIEADYQAAQELLETVESRPRVMFIYARGAGSVNVAGANTSAAQMIELAGGINAVTEYEGYKPITAEAVVASAPDVILLMTRGLDSIGGVDGLVEQPGIAQTPAGENRKVVAVDDLYLLGFSTRVGSAVLDLTYLLHDELEASMLTVLRADGRFNTLLDAVETAGQTNLLHTAGPFTIFAPNDDAFAALPESMLAGLMSSPISLQAVLGYHVIMGAQTVEDLAALEGEVQTLYPDGKLTITVTDDGVTVNESVNVVESDIVAGNGVIHIVDSVIIPQRPQ